MNRFNQFFLSVLLILLAFSAVFWGYLNYQGFEERLYKDKIAVCGQLRDQNSLNICVEKFETFHLFLLPGNFIEARKRARKEYLYWQCYEEEIKKGTDRGEIPAKCRQFAERSVK